MVELENSWRLLMTDSLSWDSPDGGGLSMVEKLRMRCSTEKKLIKIWGLVVNVQWCSCKIRYRGTFDTNMIMYV